MPPKVLHIINDLGLGGAQVMLQNLVLQAQAQGASVFIISLLPIGEVGQRLQAQGIPVVSLNLDPAKKRLSLTMFKVLKQTIDQFQPELIQTWLYYSDLLGIVAAKMAGNVPLVWGIHNTDLAPIRSFRFRWLVQGCGWLSHYFPKTMVVCSQRALDDHVAWGYQRHKMKLIPNGFDTDHFRKKPQDRERFRETLPITKNTFVIGMAARFAPEKDFLNFLGAACYLSKRCPQVHYVLSGRDVTPANRQLMQWIQELHLENQVTLLGEYKQMLEFYNGIDLFTVPAVCGEAFPMVLGEALACETLCMATDVGDSKVLLGSKDWVVPPQNPAALANAWERVINFKAADKKRFQQQGRSRIQQHFSIPHIWKEYEKVYSFLTKRRLHHD